MSEPYLPEPPPDPDGHHDPLPPTCPECGSIVRRLGLDEYRCVEHGIIRPVYGEKNGDEEILD